MLNLRLARPMLIALAACAANIFVQGSALADDAQENKALKEQMRQMMQRMDTLQKQVEALQRQQAAPPVVTAPPAAPPAAPAAPSAGPAVAKQAPPEPAFEKFAKGFYGTLDVSADYATKGMSDLGAFHYEGYPPAVPGVYQQLGQKIGPVGRVGWQADLSTNKSVLAVRTPSPVAPLISSTRSKFSRRSRQPRGRAPAIRRSPTSPRPASAMAIPSSVFPTMPGVS